MQQQRGRDTQPELALRRRLHALGLRYRVHQRLPIPGKTRRGDVVFRPTKVVVFVDGCFWHGCPEHGNPRVKSNTWYWPEKIRRNQERDRDTDRSLTELGWAVFRFWEHEDLDLAAMAVSTEVRRRRGLS